MKKKKKDRTVSCVLYMTLHVLGLVSSSNRTSTDQTKKILVDAIQHHLYNILFNKCMYTNIFCYSEVKRHLGRFVWQHEIQLLTLRL